MRNNKRIHKSSAALFTAVIFSLILATVLLVILFVMNSTRAKAAEQESINKGISHLETLENQDVSIIEEEINETRRKEIENQIKALSESSGTEEEDADENNEASGSSAFDKWNKSVWDFFDNYVILGDSRAADFASYGYLPENRVLAGIGDSTYAALDHLDEVKAINPSVIYFAYGINDIVSDSSPESYIDEVDDIYAAFHEALPKAKIYVNSMLLATDKRFIDVMPTCNEALKAYCESTDYLIYIDNNKICTEHSDCLEPDGIHYTANFFPFWATNMISTVFSE